MEYSRPDVYNCKVLTVAFDDISKNITTTVEMFASHQFSALFGMILSNRSPLDQVQCVRVCGIGGRSIICTSEAIWLFDYIYRPEDYIETDKCDKFIPVPSATKLVFEGEELDKYQDWYFPIMERVTVSLRGANSYFKWCKRTRGQDMAEVIANHDKRFHEYAEKEFERLGKLYEEKE